MFNRISILKVEGVKHVSWTDKETGERKSGVYLQCSYKDDSIVGMGVASIFVSDDFFSADNLDVGSRIMALDRGKFGFTYVGKSDK